MDTQEKQYTEGFNHGYILAQYEPELAVTLVKSDTMTINPESPHSDYFQGFASGQKQYELDKTREQSKDLSRDNVSTKGKDEIDKER